MPVSCNAQRVHRVAQTACSSRRGAKIRLGAPGWWSVRELQPSLQCAAWASLRLSEVVFVTGVALFRTAPLSGRLWKALDKRVILSIGFPLVAAGPWPNAHVDAQGDYDQSFLSQVVRGVDLVLWIVTTTSVACGMMSIRLVGDGSGLSSVARATWARSRAVIDQRQPERSLQSRLLVAALATATRGIGTTPASTPTVSSKDGGLHHGGMVFTSPGVDSTWRSARAFRPDTVQG